MNKFARVDWADKPNIIGKADANVGVRYGNRKFKPPICIRLRAHRYGLLSTHSRAVAGYPFGSVVPYVLDHDACPVPLISRLAEHTKNLAGDARVSHKHKAETVAKELRTLKAILAKAVEWKVIREHPIPHVAAPLSLDSKPPLFFTQVELEAIYTACSIEVNAGEGPQPNPVHAAIWRLYANTGMRRGEGMMLKRAWIGQEAMKILSTDEQHTKSGKWREIPITKGARIALDKLPKDGEHVCTLCMLQLSPPSARARAVMVVGCTFDR